jgi:hypothetical protein
LVSLNLTLTGHGYPIPVTPLSLQETFFTFIFVGNSDTVGWGLVVCTLVILERRRTMRGEDMTKRKTLTL